MTPKESELMREFSRSIW